MTVLVYVIQYKDGKKTKWLPESYHFTVANEVCKTLAKQGKKPIMFKVNTTITELFNLGPVSHVSVA